MDRFNRRLDGAEDKISQMKNMQYKLFWMKYRYKRMRNIDERVNNIEVSIKR